MTTGLEDALQDCLARIGAGESPMEALGRYPGLAAELAPLLRAAMAVEGHRPRPPSAFRAELQVRLAAEMGSHRPGARSRRAAERRLVARLAGMAVALALVVGSLHVASADSRPGDLLYPIKVGIARIRMAVGIVPEPSATPMATVTAPDSRLTPTPSPMLPLEAQSTPIERRADSSPDGRRAAGVAAPPAGTPTGSGPTGTASPVSGTCTATATARRAAGASATAAPAGSVDAAPVTPAATADRPEPSPIAGEGHPTPAPTMTPAPAPTEEPEVATAAIEGAVTGPRGPAPAGLRVTAHMVRPRRPGGPRPPSREAATDAEGRYRIDGLPAGTYLLELRLRDRSVWWPGALDRRSAGLIELAAGETKRGMDFRAAPLDSDPRRPGEGGPGGGKPGRGGDGGGAPPTATARPDPGGGAPPTATARPDPGGGAPPAPTARPDPGGGAPPTATARPDPGGGRAP